MAAIGGDRISPAQQGLNVKDSAGCSVETRRPVADPGPSRVVKQGSSALSASNSLYATAYSWSIVSGPAGGATIASPTSENTTFNATQNGTYVVRLTASSGSVQSAPVDITLVVDNTLAKAPPDVRFADIKAVLQSGRGRLHGIELPLVRWHAIGATVLYQLRPQRRRRAGLHRRRLVLCRGQGRINFTEIAASLLLRKPSGKPPCRAC